MNQQPMNQQPMNQKIVHKLEKELEQAIGDVLLRRFDEESLPLMPSQHTLHFMAKAAVAAYEAAVENRA